MGPKQTRISIDLAAIECLLDGEIIEVDNIVLMPATDLIAAHDRTIELLNRRQFEPDFHL
jgi:hypothetical protein